MQRESRTGRRGRFSARFNAFCFALQVVVFAAAFAALHYHLTGHDPDLPNDRAILRYLGGFAAILYGGVSVLLLLRWSLQFLLCVIEGPRSRG